MVRILRGYDADAPRIRRRCCTTAVRMPCGLKLVAFTFALLFPSRWAVRTVTRVRYVTLAACLMVLPAVEPRRSTGSTLLGSLAAADIRRHARVIAGAGGVRDVATACGTGGERVGVRPRLSEMAWPRPRQSLSGLSLTPAQANGERPRSRPWPTP